MKGTDHKTKIFLANIGIIFGIVFLGSLSADAVFGSAVELCRNLFVSGVAAGLAALLQAKAYLEKEEDGAGGGTKAHPKACSDGKHCAKTMRLFILIPW